MKHVFEVGDNLCSDAGVTQYCGVRCDVECALVPFLVHGEADVLKPLTRVVVPDLYGAVQVVLDGDEEFGRVSSGEVVVKEASREGHDARDVFFC